MMCLFTIVGAELHSWGLHIPLNVIVFNKQCVLATPRVATA